ncbi:MAG: hypothetical protein M0Q38_14665 [Bacteroidales bacterium]|jgi:3-oxoacyl-[acyl-carrier-protein] synthase-1|nr:hypothetical protein [Bacteroidales bacterium]
MKPVYIIADNIITSLGFTTAENVASMKNNVTGLKPVDIASLYPSPVILSRIDKEAMESRFLMVLQKYKKSSPLTFYTRLEKLFLISIADVLSKTEIIPADSRTLLVISTTKGNVDLLEERYKAVFNHRRLFLWELGRLVSEFFGFRNTPIIVSNACISGLVAITTAARFIHSGYFDHAVIAGGDIVSEFVISGFQSFQALSPLPCKPFDLNRNGLSLGEGCGAMALTSKPTGINSVPVRFAGGAITNDANHISGPSRTGEELSLAINRALTQAYLSPDEIGYISAHGTATPFNDEMESMAIGLSHLSPVPVNSFKGYWGHTLGAAGVIESVAAIHSLRTGDLFSTAGYEQPGVSVPLNVLKHHETRSIQSCLKTASGFGGCNAAVVYQKL